MRKVHSAHAASAAGQNRVPITNGGIVLVGIGDQRGAAAVVIASTDRAIVGQNRVRVSTLSGAAVVVVKTTWTRVAGNCLGAERSGPADGSVKLTILTIVSRAKKLVFSSVPNWTLQRISPLGCLA